ncbi:MAG: hypothetical protein WBQ73_03910, partial [Candidatus Babeliales bacterium]
VAYYSFTVKAELNMAYPDALTRLISKKLSLNGESLIMQWLYALFLLSPAWDIARYTASSGYKEGAIVKADSRRAVLPLYSDDEILVSWLASHYRGKLDCKGGIVSNTLASVSKRIQMHEDTVARSSEYCAEEDF